MNATAPTPEDIAFIILGRQSLQITRLLDVSASVALIYDYIVTFDEERRHFWTGGWSWPRAIFFLNRYFAIFVQLFNTITLLLPTVSAKFCRFALVGFLPWTGLFQIFIVQAILCFRLHAMYGKSKRVRHFLIGLFTATTIGAIVTLAFQLVSLNASNHVLTEPLFSGVQVCVVFINVKEFWTIGVPVVVFDVVAFALALRKAYTLWTSSTSVQVKVSEDVFVSGTLRPVMSGARLMRILVSHSLLYFALVSAVYIANILLWRIAFVTLSLAGTGWSIAALSVAGNRMLLAIRAARAEDGTPARITSLGEEYFEFAHFAGARRRTFLPTCMRGAGSEPASEPY